jgi:hypothetical protein
VIKGEREVAYATTSVAPARLRACAWLQQPLGHEGSENHAPYVRDVIRNEHRCQVPHRGGSAGVRGRP